jgi:hypothetical protein
VAARLGAGGACKRWAAMRKKKGIKEGVDRWVPRGFDGCFSVSIMGRRNLLSQNTFGDTSPAFSDMGL